MPNSLDQIIRPEIFDPSAYHVQSSIGMVKLDALENPYSLPDDMRIEIARLTADLPTHRHPDTSAASLMAALREALRFPVGIDIMLGNGSDEIIQIVSLAGARPGAVLMSVEPAFVMFRMIATFARMGYRGISLKADFSLDLDAMLTSIKRKIATSLRYQLLVLFLFPLLLTALLTVGFVVYWSQDFSQNQLLRRVNTDLNVAHARFVRLQRDYLNQLNRLAASHAFYPAFANGDV